MISLHGKRFPALLAALTLCLSVSALASGEPMGEIIEEPAYIDEEPVEEPVREDGMEEMSAGEECVIEEPIPALDGVTVDDFTYDIDSDGIATIASSSE